jgi:hypothetical protein
VETTTHSTLTLDAAQGSRYSPYVFVLCATMELPAQTALSDGTPQLHSLEGIRERDAYRIACNIHLCYVYCLATWSIHQTNSSDGEAIWALWTTTLYPIGTV